MCVQTNCWTSTCTGYWKVDRSLWENDTTSHLIYYLHKLFPDVFVVSITSFKSSSMQHDVHFVIDGTILSKVVDKDR